MRSSRCSSAPVRLTRSPVTPKEQVSGKPAAARLQPEAREETITTPRGLGYHFDESEFEVMDGDPGSINVTP